MRGIKHILIILTIGVLAFGSFVTQAQGGWFAYLVKMSSGEVVQVFQDGTSVVYNLGLPGNEFVSASELAFTSSGDRAGFCVVSPGAESERPARLILRDVPAQANILEIELGRAFACRATSFSTDDRLLAVGMVNYLPSVVGNRPEPSWRLLLVDAGTGQIVNELNPSMAQVAALNLMPGLSYMAYVRYFGGDQVIFTPVSFGVEDDNYPGAFLWRYTAGTVDPVVNWGKPGATWYGSELIWLDLDPNRPVGETGLRVAKTNMLMLADKSGAAFPIYHSPDWLLLDATFINSGREIAVLMLSPFAPADSRPITRWIAVNRSGGVRTLWEGDDYAQVVATPDGYGLFQLFTSGAGNRLYTLDYVSGESTNTVWVDTPTDPAVNWDIAWALSSAPAEGLLSFPAVGQ